MVQAPANVPSQCTQQVRQYTPHINILLKTCHTYFGAFIPFKPLSEDAFKCFVLKVYSNSIENCSCFKMSEDSTT